MRTLKILFVSIVLFGLIGMLLNAEYKKKELDREIMYACDGYAYESSIPSFCK